MTLDLFADVARAACNDDGTVVFYRAVRRLLPPQATVLDFGAGRGAGVDDPDPERRALRTLRGDGRRVVGVDVDPTVLDNPLLDDAHVIAPGGPLPFAISAFDLIVADFVLEHIGEPEATLAECARVVRPGGWLCARTPHKWGYPALAARLIPEALHGAVLRVAQPDRHERDVFPAYYRLNSARALRRHLAPPRWHLTVIPHTPEPSYAGSRPTLQAAFRALHRVLPDALALTLLVFARRS